jgi:hypothetical protein
MSKLCVFFRAPLHNYQTNGFDREKLPRIDLINTELLKLDSAIKEQGGR